MKMQIVTTITTLINIDTFETTHSTEVVPDDGIPESIAVAAARAGCKATLKALKDQG